MFQALLQPLLQQSFSRMILVIFLLPVSQSLFAQEAPDDIINVCSACHGFDGVGKETGFPNLWGQPETYLKHQIEAFRNSTRVNLIMDAVSHELPDKDIIYAAQYYAKQTGPSDLSSSLVWRGDKWPGDMSLGEKIAYTGKLAVKMPACVACHGPSGVGVAPFFPRLGGQDKNYLSNQLHAWKTGKRPPGTMGVMVGIAISLTDKEIEAVTAYFAAQGEKK